ncbi:MAG: Crp/Fnr family transcriptional regulator [Bacteroidota bacterium]|jgi:CRP/FNR family transcriptional regulator
MSEISIALRPFNSIFESLLMDEIEKSSKLLHLEAGTVMLEPGSYVKFIPLLVNGSIKVFRQGSDGGEILLYYVYPLETCAVSLTCCVANQKSNVKVIAEEDTTILSIPMSKSDDWFARFPSWKQFIMQTYSHRFEELLKAIDGIAFHKVDERLYNYLLEKSTLLKSSIIQVSHQQIAEELNTSREVVSRLLKQLEGRGLLTMGRNKLTLNLSEKVKSN